jgi:hypothetical protein
MPETITEDGEIVETGTALTTEQMSLAIGLTKAEIDQQISTAHAFPRSISKATKNVLSLVTLDEQSAEECNYALPRGGKSITGPSIRLAEIVAGQWGNCRVGARVVHVDRAEKYVEAEGVFHDLETNTATTARVRRRIVKSNGKLYDDDMIIVTGNAACSIAKRNAILGGVPKAVWRKAHDAALATIKGDVKTLRERRDNILKAFAAFGVKPDQVVASIDLGGIDDIMIEHMPVLIGMHAALKSGEATVEEMFGGAVTGNAGGEKKDLKGKLNDVADGGDKPKEGDGKKGGNTKGKEADQPKGDAAPGPTDSQDDAPFPGDLPSQSGGDKKPAEGKGKIDAPREPSGDEIEAAKDRGGEAYHRGMSRKAVPGEYRDVPALANAWLAAYDATKAEEEKGGEA